MVILRLQTLRDKVVTLGGLLLLMTVITMSLINVAAARRSGLVMVKGQLAALMQSHAEGVGEWVAVRKRLAGALATVALDSDPGPAVHLIKQAGQVDASYIGYADQHSVWSERSPVTAGYDPTTRPWYRQAAQSEAAVITAPYVDAATHALVVSAAQAVRVDGEVQAVAAVDVSMQGVVQTIATIRPTPNSFGFIVSRTGQILVHEQPALWLTPVAAWAPELTVETLARLVTATDLLPVEVQGEDFLLTGRPIAGTDWLLLVAFNRSEGRSAFAAMVQESLYAGLLLTAASVLLLGWLMSRALRRVVALRDAMADIHSGQGDLTRRLPEGGQDELAEVSRHFNGFVDKIQVLLQKVHSSAQTTAQASADIAQVNVNLTRRTQNQTSALMETNFSLDGLRDTIRGNAERSGQAHTAAASACAVARTGGDAVAQVVSTMSGINDASRKIGDIIGVIDSIAFQTNILALNAAVEAARAGEQGRGFAVVATEVRALAGRAGAAANEIKQLVGASVERVDEGSHQVDAAGATIGGLVQSIQAVSALVTDIATSSTQQFSGVDEVASAVNQLDRTTKENADVVTGMADAAHQLQQHAEELLAMVSHFRLA